MRSVLFLEAKTGQKKPINCLNTKTFGQQRVLSSHARLLLRHLRGGSSASRALCIAPPLRQANREFCVAFTFRQLANLSFNFYQGRQWRLTRHVHRDSSRPLSHAHHGVLVKRAGIFRGKLLRNRGHVSVLHVMWLGRVIVWRLGSCLLRMNSSTRTSTTSLSHLSGLQRARSQSELFLGVDTFESAHEPCTSVKSTLQVSESKLARSSESTPWCGLSHCLHGEPPLEHLCSLSLEHVMHHVRRQLTHLIGFSITRLQGFAPLAEEVGPPRHLSSNVTTGTDSFVGCC